MKHRSLARQSGFTLVEIAIVLVIIGLLLGGVLKGQELIENSRIKSIVNDMKAIQAAYNGYIDRYKAVPGDEAAATMTARGWAGTAGSPAATAGNSILAITGAQTWTNGGDSPGFWRALRASGLLAGDPLTNTAANLPRHGGGGPLGVASNVFGQTGTFVCAAGLTTKQASGVDTLIDGALPANQIGNNIGTIIGDTNTTNPFPPAAAAPAGTAYNETLAPNPWTLCMRM